MNSENNKLRFYKLGGLVIKLESDLDFKDNTFKKKFEKFRLSGLPKEDMSIRLSFMLPDTKKFNSLKPVYDKTPWKIFKYQNKFIYIGKFDQTDILHPYQVVDCSNDHTKCQIFNPSDKIFNKGDIHSISMLPTDQVLLARIFPDRGGLFIHSSGIIIKNKGLIFIGHSEAGKSTISEMLRKKYKLLCDDRNIVRRSEKGFNLYGTWGHGDIEEVNPDSAPLQGLYFLKKSNLNRITPVTNKKQKINLLLPCIIKPYLDFNWWEKTLSITDEIIKTFPFYQIEFDLSGNIQDVLEDHLEKNNF